MLDVNLYGFLCDEELFRDVAIPVSPAIWLRTSISRAVRSSSLICSASCAANCGGYAFSRVDLANHFNQILGRHALEHVAAGSRLQRALDFHVASRSSA